MDIEQPRQAATGSEDQAPTSPDGDFSLTIEQALTRYSDAGLPRTPRSIQRYCALGHLEGRRVDTPFGEKWLITPTSVERHIAYVKEVTPATGRDLSGPVATSRDMQVPEKSAAEGSADEERQGPTTGDVSRQVATSNDGRYVGRLESENEFLRTQILVKDSQIKELTERARETNVLIGGLQRMLSPLLGGGEGRSTPPTGDNTAR
jgi:hypothetical protein